jgi:hypothetical protein
LGGGGGCHRLERFSGDLSALTQIVGLVDAPRSLGAAYA